MTAGAPWSVKGIDPKAREVAKDLARRSGMTLGEWLNRVILEDDMPEEVASEEKMPTAPQRAFSEPRLVSLAPAGRDDLSRVAYALDRLTDRIEASETRTGLAISSVEHSVRQAVARIETNEREHLAVATRFEGAVDRVSTEQSRLAERLRRMETQPAGPRSSEALRAIEQSVSRIANDTYESEGRIREAIVALEGRIARAEGTTGGDPGAIVDEVVRRLGERLSEAETRTADALAGLRQSVGALDARLEAVEGSGEQASQARFEEMAVELTRQVEAARAEIAAKLRATSAGRVDQRFEQLAAQVETAERRSADAIQKMGREVLGMADALNRRLQASEQRGADAITQVGGEIARIAGAVEQRLGRAEQVQAEALEKLGAEIGRITERLTDRMLSSERRAAQAIDDVGEQVARVTERIEQRHERASEELAQRIRESEERTARLLEDAGDRLDHRRADPAEPAAAPSSAAFGPELFSRAETLNDEDDLPALASLPELDEEPGPVAFAPIVEPEDDLFGLDQPEPPAAEDAPRPLSTREVIEQARAAARAQAPVAAERPARIQAKARANWRTTGKPTASLFGGLKPRAQNTTLQTALMVAGVAAFMSVGAAGVMLIEGPGGAQARLGVGETMPRAAVALTPPSTAPVAPAAAPSPAPATDAIGEGYANAVQAIERGQPGGLAKLRALADAGHPPAQAYLAGLYEDGEAGLGKSPVEARRWMQRAAEGGEPTAMHNLALYEFSGVGGPADLTAAASWFRKAAERGVVSSQYNLALLYQSGSGVERDLAQAYRWFAIAAASGDRAAAASAMDLRSKLTPVQLAAAERAVETARGVPHQGSSEPHNVATAQRILGRLGYYRGASDGAVTPQLKTALSAYQRDQRLPVTGALDAATAAKLAAFTR